MREHTSKPTPKQLAFIQTIEDEFGKKFTGNTKSDAQRWLSKMFSEYKKYIDEMNLEYEAANLEIYENYGDQI